MTLPVDINDFINPILRVFEDSLSIRLNGYLVTAYLRGSAEMLEWGRTVTTDMPIYHEGPPMRQAMTYAQKHTATLVKGLNTETRDQMRNIIEYAIKNKRGVPGLSRDLRNQISNMSKVRAKVIARTETADALESAFMDRAKDLKVTGKEWVVTDPCPICEENGNAGVIAIDKPFPSGDLRPPAHPNAVFEDSTFAPYDSLNQIVRSRYSGPASTIQTERVSFTIGPNHPILTGGGWIKAGEIHEGDQLLYDTRMDYTRVSRVKAYLNKMPVIQDVFDSLLSSFGEATIATPSAYFHGDEVSAYGEINVILPTRDLLVKLDASGLEQFSEDNFVRTDAKTLIVSGIGSSHHPFERVMASPSRSMGRRNLMSSLFFSHTLPPYFERVTVVHIEPSFYDGWAYDASTSSSFYNSSGIVVKNCRCALAPVMLK